MKLPAVVLGATLLALPAIAHAQPDPFVRPLPPAAAGTETVGRFLRELGYEPKALSPDVYQITVQRDRWPVHIMLSLSTDGRRIWLESKFAPVEDPDKVPPTTWKRLLEANEKIGPAHFAFDTGDKRVHLYKSFDNQGLSVDRLKRELDHFDTTVRKTQDYWRGENFKPVIGSTEAVLPTPPIPPGAAVKANVPAIAVSRDVSDQDKLRGKWKVVEIQVKGRKTPEAVFKDRWPSLTFDLRTLAAEGPAEIVVSAMFMGEVNTGVGPTRTVEVKLTEGLPTPKIDFVEASIGAQEQGIYKLEGDTLTLCFAAPGDPRPIAFTTNEQARGWVIVLKRVKKDGGW